MEPAPTPASPAPFDQRRQVEVRIADGSRYLGRVELIGSERIVIAFKHEVVPDLLEQVLVTMRFDPIRGMRIIAWGRFLGDRDETRAERLLHFRIASFARRQVAHVLETEEEPAPGPRNRRTAFRVETTHGRLRVSVSPAIDDEQPILRRQIAQRLEAKRRGVEGWMLDLSAGGVGMMVDSGDSHAFEAGQRVSLAFALDETEAPLVIGAVVRQAEPRRRGGRYGFEFVHGTSSEHRRVQGEVLEYVMQLQRERLRFRVV